MREAIGILVSRLGHTAVELGSLSAALDAERVHGTPELIVIEPRFAGNDDLAAVRHLRLTFSDTPIAAFSATTGEETRTLEAGADVFIAKSASGSELAAALRELLNEDAAEFPERVPVEKLSKRQKQLLHLLDKGMSNRDIAESLQISEHTVKVHLWRLFRRLNVKSRSQASHLARTQGLL